MAREKQIAQMRDIDTLRKHDYRLFNEMAVTVRHGGFDNWKCVRNSLLKFLCDTYDLNSDAIWELRRLTGLKNGMSKGYSLDKHTDNLRKWSPRFDEEYNSRLTNYDEYNLRVRKGKTENGDYIYEGYSNRVDYAQELTRDLIRIMKTVTEFEYLIVDDVCRS